MVHFPTRLPKNSKPRIYYSVSFCVFALNHSRHKSVVQTSSHLLRIVAGAQEKRYVQTRSLVLETGLINHCLVFTCLFRPSVVPDRLLLRERWVWPSLALSSPPVLRHSAGDTRGRQAARGSVTYTIMSWEQNEKCLVERDNTVEEVGTCN